MLLYQGSEFVRGNKFKDSKGNILTFEKNTKDGKLFSTKGGQKVGLTEKQVAKLKLTDEKVRKALKESKKLDEKLLDTIGGSKDYIIIYDTFMNMGRPEDYKYFYVDSEEEVEKVINDLEKDRNMGTIEIFKKERAYRFPSGRDYEEGSKKEENSEDIS